MCAQLSAEVREAVADDIRGGLSPMVAAKNHGIAWSTAYGIAHREGIDFKTRQAEGQELAIDYALTSLKSKVGEVIKAHGYVGSLGDLVAFLREAYPGLLPDTHQVAHVTWSLQKQGLLTLRTHKVTNGHGQTGISHFQWIGPASTDVEIVIAAESTIVEPVDFEEELEKAESYPILLDLMSRGAKSKERARLLLEAAQYATTKGQEQELMRLAEQAEREGNLSPIENEYLRFVEDMKWQAEGWMEQADDGPAG